MSTEAAGCPLSDARLQTKPQPSRLQLSLDGGGAPGVCRRTQTAGEGGCSGGCEKHRPGEERRA